jgi:hypothetical protein
VSANEVSLFWHDLQSRQRTAALYRGHVHGGPGAGVVVSHDSRSVAWVRETAVQ